MKKSFAGPISEVTVSSSVKMRLPGMSGIALATESVRRWPRTGVVISSGYGDALSLEYFPDDLKEVVSLVPKPCDLATLPQVLADAASRARARATGE